MFIKLDVQSLCIYLELLSIKGIGKSITLHILPTYKTLFILERFYDFRVFMVKELKDFRVFKI